MINHITKSDIVAAIIIFFCLGIFAGFIIKPYSKQWQITWLRGKLETEIENYANCNINNNALWKENRELRIELDKLKGKN